MVEVDYIVVGAGLAGITFCEHLRANNKSFMVYDNASQQSSIVAAGLYNPVVLKRFTPVWKAKEQLELSLPVYRKIEERLNIKLDYKLKIFRRFVSVEEQNQWFTATDHPQLEHYLSTTIIKNDNPYIDANYGYGEVFEAGRLDTDTLIKTYKADLKNEGRLREQKFEYNKLNIEEHQIFYEDIEAKHIVFAEGFGLKKNPFFGDLPLNGTKGEVITIKAEALQLKYAVKSSVFIIPTGNDEYTVGSTYNWEDKSNHPTEEGKNELTTKLETFLKCDYKIVDHKAGVRPTVKDRRPLTGSHDTHKNLHVLNGMGTRGVMIAPYAARALFNNIEHGHAIDEEMNIMRFSS